jgi:hypothetical protein
MNNESYKCRGKRMACCGVITVFARKVGERLCKTSVLIFCSEIRTLYHLSASESADTFDMTTSVLYELSIRKHAGT